LTNEVQKFSFTSIGSYNSVSVNGTAVEAKKGVACMHEV